MCYYVLVSPSHLYLVGLFWDSTWMASKNSSKEYKTHGPERLWSTFDYFLAPSPPSFQSILYLPYSPLRTYIQGSSKNIPKEKLQEGTILAVTFLYQDSFCWKWAKNNKARKQKLWIILKNSVKGWSHKTQVLPKEHKIRLTDSNSDLWVLKFIIVQFNDGREHSKNSLPFEVWPLWSHVLSLPLSCGLWGN